MRGNIDTRLVNSGSSDSGEYKRNKGTAAGERIWIEETQKLYTRTHTATLTFTIHPVTGSSNIFGQRARNRSVPDYHDRAAQSAIAPLVLLHFICFSSYFRLPVVNLFTYVQKSRSSGRWGKEKRKSFVILTIDLLPEESYRRAAGVSRVVSPSPVGARDLYGQTDDEKMRVAVATWEKKTDPLSTAEGVSVVSFAVVGLGQERYSAVNVAASVCSQDASRDVRWLTDKLS